MLAPPRRRIAVAFAGSLLSLGLTSCGFDATTDQVYTPGEGVNNREAGVDVLHALIVSGDDGSGTVIAGLANNDESKDDALVEVQGAGEDQAVTVEGTQTDVPAGAFVQLAEEGAFSVTGEQVIPGRFVSLSFAFESGETVTLDVPVVTDDGDYADVPLPESAESPGSAEES